MTESRILERDAARIARRIFRHYGVEELKPFDLLKLRELAPLSGTGVLSKEDTASMRRHDFKSFSFDKNHGLSRRYVVYIWSTADLLAVIQLNHLGEIVRVDQETDTSSDVPGDVKLMWRMDKDGRSPEEAIEAASRVFNTVELVGMDRDEVFRKIGNHSRRPKRTHSFTFLSWERNQIVCRFGNGNYGWQFNLKFDEKGICTGVERQWME